MSLLPPYQFDQYQKQLLDQIFDRINLLLDETEGNPQLRSEMVPHHEVERKLTKKRSSRAVQSSAEERGRRKR